MNIRIWCLGWSICSELELLTLSNLSLIETHLKESKLLCYVCFLVEFLNGKAANSVSYEIPDAFFIRSITKIWFHVSPQ